MKKKLVAVLVLLGALMNCSSSSVSPGESYSVDVGTSRISWTEFNFGALRGQTPPTVGEGEAIFLVSRSSSQPLRLSNGRPVPGGGCWRMNGQQGYAPLTIEESNECNRLVRERRSQLNVTTFEDFVRDATLAINANEMCIWSGYDRQFDLQARSYGALASSRDERLFFAKLRCSG